MHGSKLRQSKGCNALRKEPHVLQESDSFVGYPVDDVVALQFPENTN